MSVRGLIQPFFGSVGPGHFLFREVDLLQICVDLLFVKDIVVVYISIPLVTLQPFLLFPHLELVIVFNLPEIFFVVVSLNL